MSKPTPGPWSVRIHERDGEMLDCFVTAPDVNGFAYAAEILGDDEYRSGLERKLADCHLIAAAPDLYDALREAEFVMDDCPMVSQQLVDAIKKARAAIAKAEGKQ